MTAMLPIWRSFGQRRYGLGEIDRGVNPGVFHFKSSLEGLDLARVQAQICVSA